MREIRLQRPSDYKPQDGARFEVHFSKARSLVGDAVAPFQAQLIQDDDGNPVWFATRAEDNSRLLELKAQGLSLATIGEALGCDKSTVKRRLDRLAKRN